MTNTRSAKAQPSAENPVDENSPTASLASSLDNLPADVKESLLVGAWKESLSSITLGIAHDLNNVLAGILGMTEVMLLEIRPDDPARDNLTQMKASARQAARLIEQLGELHRAKPGRREFHDLNVLVAQSLEILRHAVPKRFEIISEFSRVPLPVFVDAVKLQNAVASLIVGVAGTVPEQRRLTIRTSLNERLSTLNCHPSAASRLPAACLSVQYEGTASQADSRPGSTTSCSAVNAGDSGRGLWFLPVRHLVESHDGSVSIDSSDEARIRVHVFLPIADFSECDRLPAT